MIFPLVYSHYMTKYSDKDVGWKLAPLDRIGNLLYIDYSDLVPDTREDWDRGRT